MKKSTAITQLIIISAIVVVVALISTKFYFRLDFTEGRRYTLSDATEDVLDDLDNVVTIKAYFTKDLPPQLVNIRQEIENLMVEYEDNSGGNLLYEIINPNESEELEQEAMQNGVTPFQVNIQEKDQVKQQRAYMGMVVQMGDQSESISRIPLNGGMEYALTTAIKKLSVIDKPKVALLGGHGEPSLNAVVQLHQQLSILYDIEPYTITDTADIPSFYRSIIWLDPHDTIPKNHLAKLDDYLSKGGNLFIAYNQMNPNLQQAMLSSGNDIGLTSWLKNKGINLQQNYVIDAQCMAISVQSRQGPFTINRQVKLPYLPIIGTFNEHPIVEGLESLALPFTSSISYSPVDSTIQYTSLAFTSEMSGAQSSPVYVDIEKEWSETDFTNPNQPVALAMEGPISGDVNSKLAFVANGSIVTNGEGQEQQGVNEDNINFVSNAVDWLSDDTGLIELRTKGVTNRPLEMVDDTTRNLYKWGNFLVPILIILLVGLYRKQQNARRKQKWIQGNF